MAKLRCLRRIKKLIASSYYQWIFGITLGILIFLGLYYRNLGKRIYQFTSNAELFLSKDKFNQTKIRCVLPSLEPLSAEIKSFINYEAAPNCAAEIANGLFKKTSFSVTRRMIVTSLKNNAGIKCCYRSFFRKDENKARHSDICHEIVQDITQVAEDVEFIEIMCDNGFFSFHRYPIVDGFVFTPRKVDVEERISKYESSAHSTHRERRLSVVVIGIDAMSRMNFLRAMPISNAYLLKNLSAISLNGYTKVGDNSLPNITPVLTGKTLNEFKKLYANDTLSSDFVHLDESPFIWKRFAENGYRTSFAEDDVGVSAFNMYWQNAFINPPTDYYLRPFSVRMQWEVPSRCEYCYGAQLSFEKLLGNIKSMAETFVQEPYFQFTWSSKLGHSDINKMRWGDLPFSSLLQELHKNNYLNHTALFIVSDHGSRSQRFRSTNQGKLEDRLPLAYIVLPKWFQDKYSDAWENLKSNQNLVTSAFDMHKTFFDLMNLDRLLAHNSIDKDDVKLAKNITIQLGSYRGTSLFRLLPRNRNCFQAGVPLHWCACTSNKKTNDGNKLLAYQAANFTVDLLNKFLSGNSDCYVLTVKNVTRWESRDWIGCVTYSVGFRNWETRKECNSSNVLIALQIAFSVSPSDGDFETSVIRLSNDEWYLMDEVVRMDTYWRQGYCVEELWKPFCYCEPIVKRVVRIGSLIVTSSAVLLLAFLVMYYFCFLC